MNIKVKLFYGLLLCAFLVAFSSFATIYSEHALLAGVESPIVRMLLLSLFIFLFVVLAVSLISMALSKSVLAPLEAVDQAAVEIDKGNLNVRIYLETEDEFSHMAKSFNSMLKALEAMKEYLEKKNRELAAKVRLLERFKRLSVGRELRMIELKKEIAELKKEKPPKPL